MKVITKQKESEQTHQALRQMNQGIKSAFSRVKDEMDQHLDSINQNTSEIQSCYEYLSELDAKIEKLTERLDQLEFVMTPEEFSEMEITLTHREQEVFMVLYVSEDPLTSMEVARRLGLTVEMVEQHVQSVAVKGVPLLRTFVNGKVYHSLDLKFRDLQARKNILNISETLTQQLLTEKVLNR